MSKFNEFINENRSRYDINYYEKFKEMYDPIYDTKYINYICERNDDFFNYLFYNKSNRLTSLDYLFIIHDHLPIDVNNKYILQLVECELNNNNSFNSLTFISNNPYSIFLLDYIEDNCKDEFLELVIKNYISRKFNEMYKSKIESRPPSSENQQLLSDCIIENLNYSYFSYNFSKLYGHKLFTSYDLCKNIKSLYGINAAKYLRDSFKAELFHFYDRDYRKGVSKLDTYINSLFSFFSGFYLNSNSVAYKKQLLNILYEISYHLFDKIKANHLASAESSFINEIDNFIESYEKPNVGYYFRSTVPKEIIATFLDAYYTLIYTKSGKSQSMEILNRIKSNTPAVVQFSLFNCGKNNSKIKSFLFSTNVI